MTYTDQLDRSHDIVLKAQLDYHPKAIVSLVSGGDDSLTAYYVARQLGIPIDAIVHIYTGTGIPETLDFVRQWADLRDEPYMEGSAGTAYEDYVLRKGFFGRGLRAHSFAYHILKAQPLRKVISKIRLRRRNFPILMLTGIRLDESKNRMYNFGQKTVRPDPAAQNNIFVNLIEHWTRRECLELLRDCHVTRNPVAALLHRSGECMCGTMQSEEDRAEAALWFPEWGEKLDALETRVCERFPAKWGEATSKPKGQNKFYDLGICQSCSLREEA